MFSVAEIEEYRDQGPNAFNAIFRTGDTVVMVQPGQLPMPLMRRIAGNGVTWQVPGHDPMTFASDEDRSSWRRQKPKGTIGEVEQGATGRPPKWPVPTSEQIGALVADWHSDMKRAEVVKRMQERLGQPVPASWCRDQVIKKTGSARRKP